MPRGKRNSTPPVDNEENEGPAGGADLSNVTPEVFQKHYREIRTLKRLCDEANSNFRNARKRAETNGIDLKALAVMEKLSKLDEGEADALMTKVYRYAGWVSLPIGTQVGLFDQDAETKKPEADDEHRQWAAHEAGIAAGGGGGLIDDNPFFAGSPLFDQWDRGFREGLEKLAAKMGPDKKKASTSRKRREPTTGLAGTEAAGNA